MKELEQIKARIKRRKSKINLNIGASSTEESKTTNLFKIVTSIMTIYVLFMSIAIYAKKDQDAIILNEIFDTNINFRKFNKTLNNLLNLRVIDNSDEPNYDQVVSSNVNYIHLEDDYYVSEGNVAISLDDGVVTYVNGKDENYTVIVEFDSGIRATYSNLNEVNVFINDRVYKGDIMGMYEEKVEIIFIRNSEKLTYEEVIKSI